ncbi:MAG: hypothetical protein HYR55_08360 [Acidobacteria bacterium]|nr:hypothetical protein [Acidobacteriota bacterium]
MRKRGIGWLSVLALATGILAVAWNIPGETTATPKILRLEQPAGRAPYGWERCLICRTTLSSQDWVYTVQGREVPLHNEACTERFVQKAESVFAELQPRAALFHEEFGRPSPIRFFWFFVGVYVVMALVWAALCAHQAIPRGLSPVRWFFAGLLTHFVAYLSLRARSAKALSAFPSGMPSGTTKVGTTYNPAHCPACGAEHHPCANRCPGCGAARPPVVESEVQRVKDTH